MPLIVLTSDRPPELRGTGAGQTIDQVKLYGSAVRWFAEMGTHDADDAGLLHMRASACRAYAEAAGDPRPGPVHLNLSWRDPLGPEPREGDVTATSRLALEGREDLPLSSVHPAPRTLAAEELDAIAADVTETKRGLIVAGRQTDPSLAPAIAALADATGFPVLAEPTSQLRLGRHDQASRGLGIRRDRACSAGGACPRAGHAVRGHAHVQGASDLARVARGCRPARR